MTNIPTYMYIYATQVFIQYIARTLAHIYSLFLMYLTLTYLPSLISMVLDPDLPSFSDLYGT